jgi:hypothetical protein
VQIRIRDVAIAVVAVVALVFTLNSVLQGDRYASPDGKREVVITEGLAMIDTIWDVTVQIRGLPRHAQDLGCFSDDDFEDATPTGVTWVSNTEAVIETSVPGREVRLTINSDRTVTVTQPEDDLHTPCPTDM